MNCLSVFDHFVKLTLKRLKATLSDTNVKINRMGSTKRNCRKEQSFAINYFNFLIIFFYSLRTSYKELIWCINYLNAHVNTFTKRGSFIWGYFSLWISLSFLLPRGCISNVDYPVLKNTFWHNDTLTHWHINTLILFFLKKVDFKQICNFNSIEF